MYTLVAQVISLWRTTISRGPQHTVQRWLVYVAVHSRVQWDQSGATSIVQPTTVPLCVCVRVCMCDCILSRIQNVVLSTRQSYVSLQGSFILQHQIRGDVEIEAVDQPTPNLRPRRETKVAYVCLTLGSKLDCLLKILITIYINLPQEGVSYLLLPILLCFFCKLFR